MNNITVSVLGFDKKEYKSGVSIYDVISSICSSGISNVLAASVNGVLFDLSFCLNSNSDIKLITFNDEEGKYLLRHSAAHIMAQAIQRLYPDVKYAAGPPIHSGFYYDMSLAKNLSSDDFSSIENEMHSIISSDYNFIRSEMSICDAFDYFFDRKDTFKLAFLEKFKANGIEKVSTYKQGEFIDLCRGPHIFTTGQLKAFKLLKIAGAYWNNSSSNIQLQRIYGTAFFSQNELDAYLNLLEEAKLRDHRKIGKDQGLFIFDSKSPGSSIWQDSGVTLYNSVLEFIRKENNKRNYKEVKTPILFDESLWLQSGHMDHFKDNMYFTKIDKRQFAIKPMNCPGHCILYKSSLRSYRDLPLKFSEFGLVHRNELSGVLHGLFRVRSFTQDDAHVFCSYDDLEKEVSKIIEYTLYIYKVMGFKDYDINIATRPIGYIGSDSMWEDSTFALQNALDKYDLSYEFKNGEGAFYGPKIEFNIKDSLLRRWQCGTIQVDFSMPHNLDLTYEGSDGEKHTPVMIHRAVLGSIERFIGVLIEHYAGRLPFWLAPIQVQLISILDKHVDYVLEIEKYLFTEGFRVKKDLTNEKLGYKIRKAQLSQIPYMVIIGDKEMQNKTLSVRKRDDGSNSVFSIEEFIQNLHSQLSY